jgi:hypothetical protein
MSECGTACANYKELSRPSVFDKNRARCGGARNFSSCSADAQIINFRDILARGRFNYFEESRNEFLHSTNQVCFDGAHRAHEAVNVW